MSEATDAPGVGLRVLVVGVSDDPSPFLVRLFDGLTRAGLDVHVVAGRSPGLLRAVVDRAARVSRVLGSGAGADQVRARLQRRRLRPDVVYLPWNSAAVEHRDLIDGTVPVVVSCRGSQIAIGVHDPDRPDHQRDVRETLLAADLVHCVSHHMAESVAALGIDRSRLRVIHPAVDTDLFSPPIEVRDGRAGTLRIITVGGITWKKGGEDLLVAVRMLVDAGVDAHLEVVGSGPERARLAFTRHDLDLDERVELVGDLTPAEVRDRMRAADAFALPSLSEGLSNAVLEAMACELAVVTTDVGGHAEAIDDGVHGLLVASRAPAQLADALHRLADDPLLRRTLGTAGRARVLAAHALEAQVGAFCALLAEAAATRRR